MRKQTKIYFSLLLLLTVFFLVGVTTQEYGLSKAKRPFNSRLDKSKLEREGFRMLPDWKDAVARYLKEIDY